jgi:small subunit ribosomal protein S24e
MKLQVTIGNDFTMNTTPQALGRCFNQEDADIMGRYRFILIDEAHERALDSDMTLMLLRNFYQRNAGNKQLPFLLLTSATFATRRYAEYFGVGAENIVEVIGRAYPIETHWPAQGV